MTNKAEAKFVTGSTMKHVIVMSLTSSVGLMSIFMVDLIDMYFLSLLGEIELAAAIGYAGTISFFTTSMCIGIAIAMGALVAKSVGAGKKPKAKTYMMNTYAFCLFLTLSLGIVIWFSIPFLVSLLGAKGRAHALAVSYLQIIIPSLPIMGVAMCSGAVLRALGDAKRSMYSTLAGGFVNAALDPIFIFVLGMGIQGAALASVAARFTILLVAITPVHRIYSMFTSFQIAAFKLDIKRIVKLAFPAILTNMATPIGAAYVIYEISKAGESAVAGMAVINRLIPVAFAVVFAASGAIGPIIGQNYGAKKFDRLKQTLSNALFFIIAYVFLVWIILFFSANHIAKGFSLGGEAAQLVVLFCHYIALTFIFNGGIFLSNATFNNLGKPLYSTLFNFSKSTIFTIPFVYFGGLWYQAPGIIIGRAIGESTIGIIAVIFAYRYMGKIQHQDMLDSSISEK